MGLKLYWTEFSKKEIKSIYTFYKDHASQQIAKKLVLGIVERVKILELHPESGQIEGLLLEREQEFRYLVQHNYKIIYWINWKKERIEIIDVFDSRQNPIKIKRNKK